MLFRFCAVSVTPSGRYFVSCTVLYAIYVDSLISELRQSGYGLYIGTLFVGCVVYADDIPLLSVSCIKMYMYLQRLVVITEHYGTLSSILQEVRLYTLDCQLRFCVEFTWMDLLLKLLTKLNI